MCISGCSNPKKPSSGPSSSSSVSGIVTSCPYSPSYEPSLWNSPPIQTSTNCYAYTANNPYGHPANPLNDPNNFKPQPGVQCGHPFTEATCKAVGTAAQCDGMIPAPNPPVPRVGYYPVALVMDPGVDYHWYRQDSNGFWSHKPGHDLATNVDASGNPITNPETANRDYSSTSGVNYSQFCGYYYVPQTGIITGP